MVCDGSRTVSDWTQMLPKQRTGKTLLTRSKRKSETWNHYQRVKQRVKACAFCRKQLRNSVGSRMLGATTLRTPMCIMTSAKAHPSFFTFQISFGRLRLRLSKSQSPTGRVPQVCGAESPEFYS